MNLNDITANIRLRSAWEAIDLGFAMVQSWWKSIYPPLMLVTFSLAIFLYVIFPLDDLWIASIIFWWFKPLYDRLVLHVISHQLFNNDISGWQTLKALPTLIWNTGFFQTMTFRRFSLSRGFNLSIWQLERLTGKDRANRQNVLHVTTHSQAIWLTTVMIHLELFLVISLFILVFIFLPETTQKDFIDGIINQKTEYEKWINILNYAFYVLVVTFLHPFYIAGNFALYINRRTELEAWDIELDFKKLAQRLETISKQILPALLVTLLLISSLSSPQNAHAEEPVASDEKISETRLQADQSKKIIEEVMKTKNLDDKEIVKRWVKIKKDKKKTVNNTDLQKLFEPFAKFFGFIIEFGLWLLIGTGLILLFYFRDHWLHLLNIEQKKKSDYESPEVMFGMDIRPDSLPDDIAGEAQKLWQNEQHREALSLLYRGALVHLINNESIQLENSFTEGDVLRNSRVQLTKTKQNYLEDLTKQWRLIAYAHRNPAEADMQSLFNNWAGSFAKVDINE